MRRSGLSREQFNSQKHSHPQSAGTESIGRATMQKVDMCVVEFGQYTFLSQNESFINEDI